MSGFQFSANRLIGKGNSSKSSVNEHANDDTKNNTASLFKGQYQELISTEAYRVSKVVTYLPTLDISENILAGNIFPECGTVLITNKRILVYATEESILRQPFTQEFAYKPNGFGILPIVKLLKDDEDPNLLDLFILDPVSGEATFILRLQFSPDVPLLREEKSLKITLAHGEFATLCEYNPICGMVVATNYRRVVNINLKDAFGHPVLSYSEVLPSKVLLGYLRNPKYLVQSYDSQNKIISFTFRSIDEASCLLAVLEEQGLLTIIKLVKGSGKINMINLDLFKGLIPTVASSTNELNFAEQRELHKSIKFKAIQFWGESNNKLLALISNKRELVLLIYTLGKDQCITSLRSYKLSNLESDEKYPQMYCMDQAERAVIVSDSRIVMIDLNDDLANMWEDFFSVQQSVNILGINGDRDILRLLVNDGILEVQMLGPGRHRTASEVIETRIQQDLEYMSNSNANIKVLQLDMYNQFKSGINVDVENAIRKVCGSIIHNEFGNTSSVILVQDNLQLRISLLDHLAQYVASNFEISNGTKMALVNAREKLGMISLLYKCLELEEEDVVKNVTAIHGCTLGDILKGYGVNSLDLLEDYLTKILGSTPKSSSKLLTLAGIVCNELTNNYINPERNMKSQTLSLVYSDMLKEDDYPIFWGHFGLLESINQMLEDLYTFYVMEQKIVTHRDEIHGSEDYDVEQRNDSEVKVKVSQTAVGLSLMLYYCCNDILQLLQIVDDNITLKIASDHLQNFYRSNRANWIKVFIAFEKQDQMMGLIEGFNDLQSLSELLDSERRYIEDQRTIQIHEPIEIENLSAKIELQFDRCFTQYGYEFAKNLFRYYVRTGRINVLLTRFPKYTEFLDRFLSSDISYAKFSWILDIQGNKYQSAAKKLLLCAQTMKNDNILNKTLELNIAKLSMIASPDKLSKQSDMSQIEAELLIMDTQRHVESELKKFVESSKMTFEEIVDQLLKNSLYLQGFTNFVQYIHKLLEKIGCEEKPLTLLELIDLLTLTDLSIIKVSGFDEAIHLISHLLALRRGDNLKVKSLNFKHVSILKNIVLKRLFLNESWSELDAGINLEKSQLLKILATLADYNISSPQSVQKMGISESELGELEVSADFHSDYLKENNLLSELAKKENLERFLPQQ